MPHGLPGDSVPQVAQDDRSGSGVGEREPILQFATKRPARVQPLVYICMGEGAARVIYRVFAAYSQRVSTLHEELDTHHKCLGTHKQSTPRAGEGLPAGAARLGRAALQNHLFELQNAVVDVEGVTLHQTPITRPAGALWRRWQPLRRDGSCSGAGLGDDCRLSPRRPRAP